ncbi:C1q-like domain-containing protein [Cystobacter ferrugineus]|uniref:C1q-like domain-containing protein n=1 Tax=Cystobacter ferrugineus TaxID=83449 RepID=UPI0016511E24|nr:hypothetical protein [Cystobacter ferrugineus]
MIAFVSVLAQGSVVRAEEPSREETPRLEVAQYRSMDPTVSKALSSPSCPNNGFVAVSVEGGAHVSQGGATLLGYSKTYTNEGGAWAPGGGTFIAPCTGLYSFTVSLVKDPYYYEGTNDDVYSCLTQNGVDKGCAWAGATSTSGRVAATRTVALVLNKGDYVQSFAMSDGGYKRHLGTYQFTGFLVRLIGEPTP